jgi:hypothetical protein
MRKRSNIQAAVGNNRLPVHFIGKGNGCKKKNKYQGEYALDSNISQVSNTGSVGLGYEW